MIRSMVELSGIFHKQGIYLKCWRQGQVFGTSLTRITNYETKEKRPTGRAIPFFPSIPPF